MKTVQELYDDMRVNDDMTVAMTVQGAISGLLKRATVYQSTLLGDNVIDLIIGELQNAIGGGGAATHFAVGNLFAAPSGRVGSINPVTSATQFLTKIKTGQQAEIVSPQASDFSPPFGLVIQNRGISAVFISSYRTDAFTISGGLFPEILTVTKSFPAGVLIYQGADEVLPRGAFHCCDEESYELTLKKVKGIPFNEDPVLARELFSQALAALDSRNPAFLITAPSACSPCPNFLKEEEWPKIAALIRGWLTEHA